VLYDVNNLNLHYSITDEVVFERGKGGLPFIKVSTPHASAIISLLGGQVLSYIPSGTEDDLFFVSQNAYFQTGKAIKGGAPVCWPWFAENPDDPTLPFHGFARTAPWKVMETGIRDNGQVEVHLALSDSPLSQSLWPYHFNLDLNINVGEALVVALTTHNSGTREFTITEAIHSYFNIGNISQVSVCGLENKPYLDKVEDYARKHQEGPILVNGEVDRIYQEVDSPLRIFDAALKRIIDIDHSGSASTVVWNPWREISANSSDLQDDDYKRFICVETANAADDAVTISPGSEHTLTVTCRLAKN
jgi:glucose-6-phosphate 1-epimerase